MITEPVSTSSQVVNSPTSRTSKETMSTSSSLLSSMTLMAITHPPRTSEGKSLLGPIIGGMVGGTLFVAVVSAWICLWRKRRMKQPMTPNNNSSNQEATELEVPDQLAQPVFHELHEEQAPTLAWHKLANPSIFHQTRYSDTVPDSPTLGEHLPTHLPRQLIDIASSSSNQPASQPPNHQEFLVEDHEVSPQQARPSE